MFLCDIFILHSREKATILNNDVYQKTDSIYKEGIFNYLIVEDCKYRDRDYFLDYNSDVLKILLFEED